MGDKKIMTLYGVSYYMVDFKGIPLRYIFDKPYLSSWIARWQVLLAQYDIVHMVRKVVKGISITDHLADNAIEDYELLDLDFPN